jgi:hypothetical protein
MHQPIPPISPKKVAKEEATKLSIIGARAGVPTRVMLILLIAFVVAFAGASLPIFHHPTHDAPVAVGKVVLDPDGDDPREELLYHWQDPKFSQEEQRQIAWMANGLALLGIYVLTRRMARESSK